MVSPRHRDPLPSSVGGSPQSRGCGNTWAAFQTRAKAVSVSVARTCGGGWSAGGQAPAGWAASRWELSRQGREPRWTHLPDAGCACSN